MRINVDIEEQFQQEVRIFSRKVQARVKKRGLDGIKEPSTDKSVLDYVDISRLTDVEIGSRYFTIQHWCGYALTQVAIADIEVLYSKEQKDKAYAKALLVAGGSAAEDRKARAEVSTNHVYWNNIYLEKYAFYKLLQVTAQSYEKLADGYSRELSRRRIAVDQQKLGI